MSGEEAEEEHAELEEAVEGNRKENEGERVSGGENGAENDADCDDVSSVFCEPCAFDYACPAEEEDDDGHLERDAEGQGEVEEHLDVLADAVLLENAGGCGEFDAHDGGLIVGFRDADAKLSEGLVDPHLAGFGRVGVIWEDDDGGERDALGEWGVGDVDAADVGAEGDEEGENHGEHDVVEEEDAEACERDAHGHEEVCEAFFGVVETWGDESPELVDDPWSSGEDGEDEDDAEVCAEGLEGRGGHERGGLVCGAKGLANGDHEEFEDGLSDGECDDEDWDDAEERVDKAFAQLVEMIAEGHDGLCGLGGE